MTKKIFIVIPTIRNLDFLLAWKNEFRECIGIIVEDHRKKEIKTPKKYFKKVYHYCWQDIDQELGKNSWLISRRNSGIRCFGFLKAYQLGADVIITLDDDCYPLKSTPGVDKETPGVGGFVKTHIENLSLRSPEKWFPTYPHPEFNFTRGFPYKVRNKYPVVLSLGLWSGSIDLDAKTEVSLKKRLNLPAFNMPVRQFIPFGVYFPMCTMNLAFRKEITPLMYFPLMGEDNKGKKWGYDRYDDIWAGVFVKKILDHLKMTAVCGSPFVKHLKKSNLKVNLKKEKAGMKMNEYLWKSVDKIKLTKKKAIDCYRELVEKIDPDVTSGYFKKLKKAMRVWIGLF